MPNIDFYKSFHIGMLLNFLCILAMTTPVATATPVMRVRPMHFANFLSFHNGNYNMSWMFNSSMDTLHFLVEVRTTGWIGFGIASQAPNRMMNYDVAVGGVLSGIGYLKVTRLSAFFVIVVFVIHFH